MGSAGLAYRLLRHLTVVIAALWTVLADLPASTTALTVRIVGATLVVAIDVVLIGDSPLRFRGPRLDPLLGLVALIGLGLINPAALVPVAVALTAGYLCFLGPTWVHAPAAVLQLGGTGLIGALSDQPDQLWALLPVMALADAAKVLGAQLVNLRLALSDRRFATIIGETRAIAWTLHCGDSDSLRVTPNAVDLLGWEPGDWNLDGFVARITHPDDIGLIHKLIRQSATATDESEAVVRLHHADGSLRHFLVRVFPTPDDGGPTRGVLLDITRRAMAETELKRFAEVTAHSPVGCVVLELPDTDDPAGLTLRFANPVALDTLGLTPEQVAVGVRPADLFRTPSSELVQRFLADVARTGKPLAAERLSFPERSGAWFNIRGDKLSDGTLGVTFEDVTSAVRAEERLRHQALHDALTGLPNRIQLDEHLRDAIGEAATFNHTIALLLMDLTQFKQVNDAMGHRAGDQLLVAIADRLQSELTGDFRVIVRLGGDEFALLTHPITGEEEAVDLARRTIGVLERPFEVDGIPLQSTANIGVAMCPDHATGAEALLKSADVAMYQAKRNGQPLEVYRTNRDQSSLRKVTLLGELRRAMAAGELALYYQPALDLHTGQITKVEALVRWHHRDHGLMLPVEFIETAEASGMIHPLTRWIVAEASRGANRMHDSGLKLRVAANLSVRNLQDPDLVSFFELLSRTDNFHPERLELEITETELMSDAVQAFEVLDRLRSIGLSVAVDDFGVGHSSLAYLKHLPLSHLKIDRGFVTTITSDPGDAAIVRSTIELAHNLGLTVTAEGAGDLETLMLLKDMGCDLVQGFFISEAVPFEKLGPLVAEVNQKVPEILRTGRLPENTPPGVLVGNRVNPDRQPSGAAAGPSPLPEGTGRALTAVANRALGRTDETIDLTEASDTPETRQSTTSDSASPSDVAQAKGSTPPA